jgi:hypothetical protein
VVRWTEPDYILSRALRGFENTYFGGDSFPLAIVNLGAAGHAGFVKGARYHFQDTVWFFPSHNGTDPVEFDPESFLYRQTLAIARHLVMESRGRYFVSTPDISGNLDALAHLRGSAELLIDMVEQPERVKESLRVIQDIRRNVTNEIFDIIKETNEDGSCVGWLRTWAPGWHDQMQVDLSAMISPAMFKEFAMPELEEQCAWLDFPLYHFDGVEQLRFIDQILSLERLKIIQWTCVAGQPSPIAYIKVLQNIQNAGKNLLLRVQASEVRPLMEQLSSRGLYLLTEASDREEADNLEKLVAQTTHE